MQAWLCTRPMLGFWVIQWAELIWFLPVIVLRACHIEWAVRQSRHQPSLTKFILASYVANSLVQAFRKLCGELVF